MATSGPRYSLGLWGDPVLSLKGPCQALSPKGSSTSDEDPARSHVPQGPEWRSQMVTVRM